MVSFLILDNLILTDMAQSRNQKDREDKLRRRKNSESEQIDC